MTDSTFTAADLKAQKVKKLAEWCAKSDAMKSFLDYQQTEWEVFLSLWPEKGLDDLQLVLKEEEEMNLQVDNTGARKLQTNETRLQQRLQKIRLEAEELTRKDHGNA